MTRNTPHPTPGHSPRHASRPTAGEASRLPRNIRRGLLAGAAAAAALSLAVPASARPGGGGQPPAAAGSDRAAHPAAAAQGADYVALGDSYSAGAGILPLAPGAPLLCAQSGKNYPRLLAGALDARLKDVSCALAETKHLEKSQYPGVAPQLDALGGGTDLVTLTLGGNDNNVFLGSILACGTAGLGSGGKGSPCKDKHGSSYEEQIDRDTYPALKSSLEKIKAKAPAARVVVLGYPWIMPEQPVKGCFAKMPIAEGDVPYMRSLQTHLNEAVARAARETGSTFVDLAEASDGHDACAPAKTRWVEPVLFGSNFIPVHPNATGQQAMASATDTALRTNQG
ncbi:putative secreted hydrolase [Streptomyces albus]|uniref:Putative secreted hydrolase n=1 Tax=Streptomyces albus (strain ATCC 21838 / DSM 41398 / FERM P-419 / JCM 4703 / NBRC 107858) TaxID=1081613 RepID=A0A0B5ERI5_STRA4|nr:putative secreted hydrolase [Streptomyces albus]AOU79732.1 putative secreted hydrolase [Streptomyces albus]AYN35456.1 SGNH/GDSL hydrolase family protein [Streptomyces albus]